MTKEYATLRELDVQPGDVVVNNLQGAGPIVVDRVEGGDFCSKSMRMSHAPVWRIVSRASDTHKPIRDMTDAEIGALVRAKNEGKAIEVADTFNGAWEPAPEPGWYASVAYRVRPEPKRETVTLHGSVTDEIWGRDQTGYDTHRITFDLVDGEPDSSSIKMEKITQ